MQPLNLKPQKKILVEFHRKRQARSTFTVLSDDQVLNLLGIRSLGRHPTPFAKRPAGLKRRVERAFITRQKCGFGCD